MPKQSTSFEASDLDIAVDTALSALARISDEEKKKRESSDDESEASDISGYYKDIVSDDEPEPTPKSNLKPMLDFDKILAEQKQSSQPSTSKKSPPAKETGTTGFQS